MCPEHVLSACFLLLLIIFYVVFWRTLVGIIIFFMHRTPWLIIIFFCYYSMKKMKLFLKVYFKKTGMLAMVKIVLLISLTTKKW